MHGPPGTGKTLLARAVGNIWKQFDSRLHIELVSGPQLFNQFVGETEKAVRNLFKKALDNLADHDEFGAELIQHLVIVDEIDSMFGCRGVDSSSPAADRAAAQFISMMDDLRLRQNHFIIGTTNRFDLVDPAVIRPGRLGLHLEMVAVDIEDKVDIIKLYLEQLQSMSI